MIKIIIILNIYISIFPVFEIKTQEIFEKLNEIKKTQDQEALLNAIVKKENSNPLKNRYGLMCWNGKPRHLCMMTEEQARQEVLARFKRYVLRNGNNLTLRQAMHIYAPANENNIELYLQQIEAWTDLNRNIKMIDIL